jgi:hypothetical protein
VIKYISFTFLWKTSCIRHSSGNSKNTSHHFSFSHLDCS